MRKLVIVAAAMLVVACTTSATTAQPLPEKILIMGSSTTACAGDLDTPANCYVNLVKTTHPLDEFTVLGRGGTYVGYGTTAQNWTTTVIPTGHDRVVIQLGINDWYVPVPPATYRTQLNALIKRVRTANPDAAIAWMRAWMPVPTGNVQARNAMWALHGQTTADAMLFDQGTFLDMGTSPGLRRSTLAGDGGWHYNDRGHAELAAAINKWLG
jgi:lysophospholipase L1-like esterase